MADHQARRGVMAPWANGKRGKEFRAAMGRKPIVGIFSVGLEEPYRWKDSVQNPFGDPPVGHQCIANGLRPWFTKFAGSINDPRWLKPVEELYQWCATHERYLRHERPLARVAIVYSQQSMWFHTADGARAKMDDAADGWYHALVEARTPFEMVHDRMLDAEHLAPFKTLICRMSSALRCAVRPAPRLCGAGRRSGRDVGNLPVRRVGRAAEGLGLASLLGVSFAGKIEGPMHNAYVRLEHDTAKAHPLLAGLEDAPRIVHGVSRVEVTPTAKFSPPLLTHIPSYPDFTDGEGVHQDTAHRDSAGFPARGGRGPGGLFSLGHRPDVLGGVESGSRPAAGERRRLGDR